MIIPSKTIHELLKLLEWEGKLKYHTPKTR